MDRMVCGLDGGELFILNALYGDQCVNKNRSFNLGVIAKQFRDIFNESPEDVARRLINKRYITPVPKKDIKYYISDMGRACYAINQHGGNATEGRILPHKVFRLEGKLNTHVKNSK
jgi:hypothetical protein